MRFGVVPIKPILSPGTQYCNISTFAISMFDYIIHELPTGVGLNLGMLVLCTTLQFCTMWNMTLVNPFL